MPDAATATLDRPTDPNAQPPDLPSSPFSPASLSPADLAAAVAYAASLAQPTTQETNALALAYAASLAPPRAPTPPRYWGSYYIPTPKGRRDCSESVQVKLLKFLLAFEQDGCLADALAAADVSRRQYNRWLLCIPKFAADLQDLREDRTDHHEKLLNQRIEKGDGLALRMQLKAERPEKYDPRYRRSVAPAPPPSPPLPSFPMNKRIDLAKAFSTPTAQPSLPLSAAKAAGLGHSLNEVPKKKTYWESVRGPAPVLR